MKDGQCVNEQFFKDSRKVYLAFAIMFFTSVWAVPVMCFFILYGMVAITMQRRKLDSQFESIRYAISKSNLTFVKLTVNLNFSTNNEC